MERKKFSRGYKIEVENLVMERMIHSSRRPGTQGSISTGCGCGKDD